MFLLIRCVSRFLAALLMIQAMDMSPMMVFPDDVYVVDGLLRSGAG